jgi:hypothetical protein
MRTVWRWGLGGIQDFFRTIRVLRAPLLLAVVSFLILSTPAQILELYLMLARDWWRLWPQAVLALASLAGLSLFITYVARELTRTAVDAGEAPAQPGAGATGRTMPIVLGLLPLLGAALGLYLALASATTPSMRQAMATFDTMKSEAKVAAAAKRIEAYFKSMGREPPETLKSEAFTPANLTKGVRRLVPPAILDAKEKTDSLQVAIYLGVALCLACVVLLLVVFVRRKLAPATRLDFLGTKAFHPAVTAGVLITGLALNALFAAQYLNVGRDYGFDFTAIPRALGTLFLVNLSLMFVLFLCAMLTRAHERYKVPLLTLFIVSALVLSWLNLNDNHTVRLMEVPQADLAKRQLKNVSGFGERPIPVLQDAFSAWMAARPPEHTKKFEKQVYPIYIVAAQGGGMYAANMSGLYLARFYDRCPAIRHHLFAVSGVSGGSVGAGFFAALLNEPGSAPLADTCSLLIEPPGDGKGPLEKKMEGLLQTDFLAPVAASFLFPDLLQRFLPVPIEALDRARAFEAGLEQAWASVIGSQVNPLRLPFWQHWRADGPSPMLMLNTTVVETGKQAAIAPIELTPTRDVPHLESFHQALKLSVSLDVPLSTAMSLSARFPLVMPAGVVRTKRRQFRLVDGGYFENSAVDSALAMAEQLLALMKCTDSGCVLESDPGPEEEKRKYRIHLLILTDWDPAAEDFRDAREQDEGLNELLSPVRAMFNSRVARGELSVSRRLSKVGTFHVAMNHRVYKLPLGWQISAQVQGIISAQIGELTRCTIEEQGPQQYWNISNSVFWIEQGVRLLQADSEKHEGTIGSPFANATTNLLAMLFNNHCAMHNSVQYDVDVPVNAK